MYKVLGLWSGQAGASGGPQEPQEVPDGGPLRLTTLGFAGLTVSLRFSAEFSGAELTPVDVRIHVISFRLRQADDLDK